jgi:chemotaxis protein MotA
MSPLAIIGLLVALGGLVFVVIASGANPMGLWDLPSFTLVLGGTIGITMMTTPTEDVITALKLFARAFGNADPKFEDTIGLFVELAEQARREGLLSLEERVTRIESTFIKKGMQLLVDGTDPALIRQMLELDIDQLASRHARRYGTIETMGAYAPTMGMIGTVVGLVFTLGNLSSPDEIGSQVALAFITTLYGSLFSNFIFMPVSGRLKRMSATEVSERELAMEGMLAIQAGDNPQIVRQKLEAFIPVKSRDKLVQQEA